MGLLVITFGWQPAPRTKDVYNEKIGQMPPYAPGP